MSVVAISVINIVILYVYRSLEAISVIRIVLFYPNYCTNIIFRSVVTMSELRKNPDYVLYYTNIAWLIFTGITGNVYYFSVYLKNQSYSMFGK